MVIMGQVLMEVRSLLETQAEVILDKIMAMTLKMMEILSTISQETTMKILRFNIMVK